MDRWMARWIIILFNINNDDNIYYVNFSYFCMLFTKTRNGPLPYLTLQLADETLDTLSSISSQKRSYFMLQVLLPGLTCPLPLGPKAQLVFT